MSDNYPVLGERGSEMLISDYYFIIGTVTNLETTNIESRD